MAYDPLTAVPANSLPTRRMTVDPPGLTSHNELPHEPELLFRLLTALSSLRYQGVPRLQSLLALSCNRAKLEAIPVKTSGEV